MQGKIQSPLYQAYFWREQTNNLRYEMGSKFAYNKIVETTNILRNKNL